MANITEFGKLCKKYRVDANMVLKDVAKEIGCSQSNISSMETGRNVLTDSFLNKLIEIYNIPPQEIKNFKVAGYMCSPKLIVDKDKLSDSQLKRIIDIITEE